MFGVKEGIFSDFRMGISGGYPPFPSFQLVRGVCIVLLADCTTLTLGHTYALF